MHEALKAEEDIPFAWSDRILRDEVVQSLRHVIDPDLHKDIVSCGFLKNLEIEPRLGHVSFTLELTTPACPEKERFHEECYRRLKSLDWVNEIDINFSASSSYSVADVEDGLKNVREVILVSSCKGGVGKSTIAANLAILLAQKVGTRVGLVDLDVYGSSLPALLPQVKGGVIMDGGFLTPKELRTTLSTKAAPGGVVPNGPMIRQALKSSFTPKSSVIHSHLMHPVKVMSAGWLRNDYIAMRGPLASDLATQLLCSTNWAQLDYLLVDMPPGTGDIHLQIAELIPRAKFILVTAPHHLSFEDAQKGFELYTKARLTCVGVIVNQSAKAGAQEAFWNGTSWTASTFPSTPAWLRTLSKTVPLCELPHAPELAISKFVLPNQNEPVGPWALAATLGAEFEGQSSSTLHLLVQFATGIVRFTSVQRFTSHVTPEARITGEQRNCLELVMPILGDKSDIISLTAQALRDLCDCEVCSSTTRLSHLNPAGVQLEEVMEVDSSKVKVRFSDAHEASFFIRDLLKRPEGRRCGISADW